LVGGLPVPDGKDATYKQSYEKVLAMVKALFDAKIPIVSGTDSIAGLMLHHELALYARAGIPNGDILRIASLEAAKVMKQDKKTGSIAPGKAADFFLTTGDPDTFRDMGRRFLQLPIGEVERGHFVRCFLHEARP
jgi:imidazolonepropionase-like amidohydrolase